MTVLVNNEPIAITKKGIDIISPKAILLIEKDIDISLSQKLEKENQYLAQEGNRKSINIFNKTKRPYLPSK